MSERVYRSHGQQFAGGAIYYNDYGSVRVSPSGYLHTVVVKPEHRGQGRMRDVLRMATDDADAKGNTLYTNPSDNFLAEMLEKSGRWELADSSSVGHSEFDHLPGYIRRPYSTANDPGVQ